MTYLDKLQYFINEIMSNAVSILLYMCSLLAGGIAFLRWVKNKDMKDFEILFIACIALVLFMSAFGPTPSWPQYIFAPLPFIIILMIIGLEKYHLRGFDLKPVAGVILLIAWLGGGSISKLITDFQSLGVPSLWQPVMMHQYSLQLKENLSTTKGKVLTLAPAFPLEGGLDAYEMFAVGPFSWRTAQFLTSEKRQKFGIIAAEDLDTYLKDNFPQAILTGLETNYDGFMVGDNQQIERPLIQYALQNGYIPHDIQPGFIPNQTTLWIRP